MLISRSPLKIDEIAKEKWGDIHKGETAIVIGNGDSLKSVPKEFLNKYPSFGSNFIYMLPFQPTYFSCVGDKYLLGYAGEMYSVVANADTAFLSSLHLDKDILELQSLYSLNNVELVGRDTITFPGEYWFTGGTVTYVALKVAYFMGFETILIVGCDHDEKYAHFYGNHLNVPPPQQNRRGMTYHYFVAGEVYKEADRRIVNLSLPSRLDEFFERGEIGDWL